MTIRDVLLVIRQRWWVLLLCIVLCGGIGAGASLLAPTTYSSTATVVVAVPGINQDSLQVPGGISVSQRTTNYAGIAEGPGILSAVISDLGLATDPDSLSKQITVEIPAGTTLITLKAQDESAKGAQALANALAAELTKAAARLEAALGTNDPAVVISVADPGPLPEVADPRGFATNTALGLIVGILLGAAALWFLEFADDTVRQSEDLAAATRRPVLTTVAGMTGSALPETGAGAERFRTIHAALRAGRAPASGPAIYVVAGLRRSTAAALVAANMAGTEAQSGRRVLVIDGELAARSLTSALGMGAATGLGEVLESGAPFAPARWSDGGCDVIPAGHVAATQPGALVQSEAMLAILDRARAEYDVTIVAMPPVLSSADVSTIADSTDGVILVADWGQTTFPEAEQAQNRAAMGGGQIAGWVLADVPHYRMKSGADFVPQPH